VGLSDGEETIYWRDRPYHRVPGLTSIDGEQVYRSPASGALGAFNREQNWRKCERVIKDGVEYVRVDGTGSEHSYRSVESAAQGVFSDEGGWYEYAMTENGRRVFRSPSGALVWEDDGSAYIHRSTPEEERERSRKINAYIVIAILVLFILSLFQTGILSVR
jgi:hypothetical protein